MSFDRSHQGKYRPLVEAAWRADCSRSRANPADKVARERWYRAELLRAGGWHSSTECNNAEDFDALMLHFAQIAGDWELVGWYSVSAERRYNWLIRREMRRAGVDVAYVQAIARNMGVCRSWEDLDESQLRRILIALKLHNRRRRVA